MGEEILLILSGVYLAWSLGANDAGNIISMAVGTKTASYRKAMIFLILCLAFGSIFLSKEVIKTVSSGIVDVNLITMSHATIALFVSAGWVHFATWKKWPVSISQSVVSSVLGIGMVESFLASENLIQWDHMIKIVGVWLFSPIIGFLAGWLIFKVVHGFVRHKHFYFKDTISDIFKHPFQSIREFLSGELRKREHVFQILLLLSAGYMAVALGANTVATTTGLLYSGFYGQGTLLGYSLGDLNGLLVMKLIVLVSVIVGIVTYGKRLTSFLANRLMELNVLRGALIQFSAASVIIIAALSGYPVSTTGVFVGSFLGVDSGEEHPTIKSHASRDLIYGFLVTIPVTVILSGLLTWLLLNN